MASSRPLTRRRRSQSTSTTPTIIRRSPDNSWKAAHKRAHSQNPLDPQLSHQHDLDEWRRGKRRRRNFSPSSRNTMQVSNPGRVPPPTAQMTPGFATTSAAFHLFPNRSTSTPRSHHTVIDAGFPCDIDCEVDADHDLNGLRSHAFKELHQSVAENGECFIQRMRSYEQKRALQEAGTSVNRGRTQFIGASASTGTQHLFSHVANYMDSPSGCSDLGRVFSPVSSTSMMEMDQDENRNHTSLSLSGTNLDDTDLYPSDDEEYVFIDSMDHSPLTPELSQSQTDSMASSVVSLPSIPPLALSGTQPGTGNGSASRSESALSALTLAIANGAGGLNDYAELQPSYSNPPMDHCQVGELWR
ncbi:hypothetical protein BDN72DRAFT_890756 [Pluteus cervinus]|uniref:Uncharacterized protein n=1 Tax=Pluteus cervinus TaxID=181527 RepID=A0ACD3BH40_9AGAR|nr:hypothetical protein BDN72DRAFT_890756 [Pluteus cervinus]